MRSLPPLARELAWGALVLLTLSYSWLFSGVSSPNERTRIYLTVALVEDGVLHVDGPLARYGRVYDLAEHGGHYYTDKAPGSSLLAAPVYTLARAFHGPDAFTIQELVNLMRTWLMLPTALAGFLLLRRLLGQLTIAPATRDVIALGYVLATPAFHYGTAFYGHVIVSTLCLAALVLLGEAGLWGPRSGSDMSPARYHGLIAGAGAASGLMGLTEYQAIVMAALLALPVALAPTRRFTGLLAYGAGATPFAVALLVYNSIAFGGPFELSYHHLAGQQLRDLHGFGLAGATHPTWEAIYGLTLSRHRGLITTSPLTAFGLVGLFACRKTLPRALHLSALAITLYFLLIVSSSSVWYGGWSFGPRLLVPTLPLLAVAAARLLDDLTSRFNEGPRALLGVFAGALARASILFGFVYHGLIKLTFAELPPTAERPLPDSVAPMLEGGYLSPNLACKVAPLGLDNVWPALALAVVIALIVALRGRERTQGRRALRVSVSVAVALFAFTALWREEPSTSTLERAKWAQLMRGFMLREVSCAKESPKPPQR